MAEEKDPIEKEIHDTLTEVRHTNDYSGCMSSLKKTLDIRESEDDSLIYSMLIYTADKLSDTLERDEALMALGLLRGFEWQRVKEIKQRRLRFLRASTYIGAVDKGK